MVFLNSYSTSNFNSGLQLYNFNNPFGTVQDLTLGNIQVNNSINSVDGNLLLIGDNTEITRIGAANREVEFKGETFLKDLSPGVLQLDNNSKIFSSNSFTINSVNVTGNITAGNLITGNNGLEIKGNATFRNINDNTDYIQINPLENKIFTSDNSNVTFDGQNSSHYIGFINYSYVSVSPSFRLPNLTASKFTKINQNKELITSDILEDDVLNLVQDLAAKVSKSGDTMSGDLTIEKTTPQLIISDYFNKIYLSDSKIEFWGGVAQSRAKISKKSTSPHNIPLDIFDFTEINFNQKIKVDDIENYNNNILNIGCTNTNTTLNIGTGTHTNILNIGTGTGSSTINIGNSGDSVNINGTLNYIHVQDLQVTDKDIYLNQGSSGSGTARGAGIYIKDNNSILQSYIIVNSLGTGFFVKSPESENILNINLNSFTSSGSKFLKSIDQGGMYYNMQPTSIIKQDLPNSTVFNDQENNITGGTTTIYNASLAIKGNINQPPHFGGYVQFTPGATFKIFFSGDRKLSLDGQDESNASNIFEITGFNVINSLCPLDMGNKKISSSFVAIANNDIPNKLYVDNGLNTKLNLTGGTISGQLIIDNNRFYIMRNGGNINSGPYGDYQGNGSLFVTGKTNTNKNIAMGIDETNDLYIIQAIEAGVNLKPLSLNPSGGQVKIGGGGLLTSGNINLSNLTASRPLSLDSNKNIISGDLSQSVITNLISDLASKLSLSGGNLTGALIVRATTSLQGALYTGQQTFHSVPLQLRIEDDSQNIQDNFETRQQFSVSGSTSLNPTNKNIRMSYTRLNNSATINPFTDDTRYFEYAFESPHNRFHAPKVQTYRLSSPDTIILVSAGNKIRQEEAPTDINDLTHKKYVDNAITNAIINDVLSTANTFTALNTFRANLLINNSLATNNINIYSNNLGSSSNIYGSNTQNSLNLGFNDLGSFIQSYSSTPLLIQTGSGANGIVLGSQTTTAQPLSIYTNTTFYQSNNTNTNINFDMPNNRFYVGDHDWYFTGRTNRKLFLNFPFLTALKSDINIFENSSGGVSTIIWNGDRTASNANPSGIGSVNSFTISGNSSEVNLQSWNSRPLRINQLGNGVAFFSPGAPSAISQYGTYTIYNPNTNNAYLQLGFQVCYTGTNNITFDGQGLGYSFNLQGYANYFVGANWQIPSDKRRKKNIKQVEDQEAINIVKKLNPIHYEYIHKNSKKYVGYIAQEIEEIAPECVDTLEDEEKTKALDYNSLFCYQSKVIQNLLKRVEYLEGVINKLSAI